MKRISIIIATYNAAKYIERCLDSIIVQKNNFVEIIIIDGNSSDKTVDIINHKYINDIDYFVSEKDNGVYDAWNKGIKVAKGEWIQFIGADDTLLPGAIEAYSSFLEENCLEDIDFVSAKSEYVNSQNKLLKYRGNVYQWDIFRRQMCISHGSTLHSKNLFREVGYYNLNFKLCADYELLLRKGDKVKSLFFDNPVIRMQAGGMSFSIKGQFEAFKIKKLHNTIPIFANMYYLTRGILAFIIRKIIWNVK